MLKIPINLAEGMLDYTYNKKYQKKTKNKQNMIFYVCLSVVCVSVCPVQDIHKKMSCSKIINTN